MIIKTVITALETDFNTFADELGYLPTMVVSTNLDGTHVMGPNTQTKTEYLSEYFKRVIVNELYRQKANVLDKQVLDARQAEKDALKAGITSAVTIEVTP